MLGTRAPKPISVKGIFIQIVGNKIQQLCIVISRKFKARIVSYFVKSIEGFFKTSESTSSEEFTIWVVSTSKLIVLDFFLENLKKYNWGTTRFPKDL